ncbi:hypothetical protein DSO57_1006838 [Entomophthora muscae]|uniref:Uncharacterized protein n=1 Tax=Entomophthora muscae TaxID=34485 RepID=A0ACC2TVC7_9FUNG|nr:hypothetical protein DSO57_1006838 [Entomophthora muscae]
MLRMYPSLMSLTLKPGSFASTFFARSTASVKRTALKKSKNFEGTYEFIEKTSAVLSQYQYLVYGSQKTLEGKHTRLLFLETQGLDWLCKALTREYYQYIETHALSNVEKAYVLICCLGIFKTCGQLFHSPVAPEPVIKAKPEIKAIMPSPAADMGDTMKKLSDTISSLHITLQNFNPFGEEGHPFIYCPTLCAPEAKASTSEAKPPKTKSSKPKKEANASSAKDDTYLVESLAAVRSNVAQKHCLSQTVHPYSTPGKTKGSEPLKSELANHENLVSGDQSQQQDQQDVPSQEPVAEPYGVSMDKEDGTYNEAPTIEV